MDEHSKRSAALGQLFRGIAHELANSLNNVVMNAELAKLSPEDCADALATISRNGREGGQLLKQLSAFSVADHFKPVPGSSLADAVTLAQRLIVSRARRENLELQFSVGDDVTLPLDTTGLAITLALLINSLCGRAGAATLSYGVEAGACLVALDHDAGDIEAGLAGEMAAELSADHGGSLQLLPQGWRLILPLSPP